jgi:hypothetical protein
MYVCISVHCMRDVPVANEQEKIIIKTEINLIVRHYTDYIAVAIGTIH